MCINCNLPLPIKPEVADKYNLPKNVLISSRQLCEIIKEYYALNDTNLKDNVSIDNLIISEITSRYFEPSFQNINTSNMYNFEWIFEKTIDKKYPCGQIVKRDTPVPRENDFAYLDTILSSIT